MKRTNFSMTEVNLSKIAAASFKILTQTAAAQEFIRSSAIKNEIAPNILIKKYYNSFSRRQALREKASYPTI